jgi:hypothetical protein
MRYRALRRFQPERECIRVGYVDLERHPMAASDRTSTSDVDAVTGVVHRRAVKPMRTRAYSVPAVIASTTA